MDNHNPYQQPNSHTITHNNSTLNHLPIISGIKWLLLAWQLFWLHPIMYMVLSLACWLVVIALAMTVYLSPLILPVLFFYITAIYFLSYQTYHKKPAHVGDWMVLVSEKFISLISIVLLAILTFSLFICVILSIIYGILLGYNKWTNNDVYFNIWFNIPPNTPIIYLVILATFMLWIVLNPIIMTTLFSPMLILFESKKPFITLSSSFQAYFANFLPLTLYSFLSLVLLSAMGITLMYHGMFILLSLLILPIIFIGFLAAYCQIFNSHNIKAD